MKLHTKSSILLLQLALALVSNSATAESSLVFNYGLPNDYVTSDTTFDRTATTTVEAPTTQIAVFSITDPLLKPSETGYTGPTIFGGYQFSSSTTSSSFPRQQIRNYTDKPDSITLQNYSQESWSGSELALHGVFLFKQQDFNEGFNTGAISLDGMSVNWSSYFKGGDRNVEGRYVIQIGDKLFISNTPFSMTNRGSNLLTEGSLAITKWAPYLPEVDLNFDASSAIYAPLELKNIQAVGIYFEEDRWFGDDSVAAPYVMSITAFKAIGSAE